jgi:hypothetical protein
MRTSRGRIVTHYNFDNFVLPVSTPLSATAAGITATFSTPDALRNFVLVPLDPYFIEFHGNGLADAHLGVNEVDIRFSENIATISMHFGTVDRPLLFRLQAFSGGLSGPQVGETSAYSMFPPDGRSFPYYPEGDISFSGAVFDAVRLTSDAGRLGDTKCQRVDANSDSRTRNSWDLRCGCCHRRARAVPPPKGTRWWSKPPGNRTLSGERRGTWMIKGTPRSKL